MLAGVFRTGTCWRARNCRKLGVAYNCRKLGVASMSTSSHKVVTFVGGGNGSHVGAGYVAAKGGFIANVLTRRPQVISLHVWGVLHVVSIAGVGVQWQYSQTHIPRGCARRKGEHLKPLENASLNA